MPNGQFWAYILHTSCIDWLISNDAFFRAKIINLLLFSQWLKLASAYIELVRETRPHSDELLQLIQSKIVDDRQRAWKYLKMIIISLFSVSFNKRSVIKTIIYLQIFNYPKLLCNLKTNFSLSSFKSSMQRCTKDAENVLNISQRSI